MVTKMFFSRKKKIQKRRDALCNEADIFIQVHFVRERGNDRYKFNTLALKSDPEREKVTEWLQEHDNPSSYSAIVCSLFKDSGKEQSVLCEKLLLEKDYFSNLERNLSYIPPKGEAIIMCFAFKLSYEAARVLLRSAGYALTNSEKSDLIVRFFLETQNHNINDLNYVLNKLCDIKLKEIV